MIGLSAKAGSGKSAISQFFSTCSERDIVTVKALFGSEPRYSVKVKDTEPVLWEEIVDVFTTDENRTITPEYKGLSFYVDGYCIPLPSVRHTMSSSIDDAASVKDSISAAGIPLDSRVFKLHREEETQNCLSVYKLEAFGHIYLGFNATDLLSDKRIAFDGIPYIGNGEGDLSLSRKLRFNYIMRRYRLTEFDVIGHCDLCFIDSITIDLLSLDSNQGSLSSGLNPSFPAALARYNKSLAIIIHTRLFDSTKDPLSSFNFTGYTAGYVYVDAQFSGSSSDMYKALHDGTFKPRLFHSSRQGDRTNLYEFNRSSSPKNQTSKVEQSEVSEIINRSTIKTLSAFLDSIDSVDVFWTSKVGGTSNSAPQKDTYSSRDVEDLQNTVFANPLTASVNF